MVIEVCVSFLGLLCKGKILDCVESLDCIKGIKFEVCLFVGCNLFKV